MGGTAPLDKLDDDVGGQHKHDAVHVHGGTQTYGDAVSVLRAKLGSTAHGGQEVQYGSEYQNQSTAHLAVNTTGNANVRRGGGDGGGWSEASLTTNAGGTTDD